LISQTNPSSRPCVLVVEDEFFCRFHAVDLVEAAGYRAIEASNADEAIAILEARKDIRIVFTDMDTYSTSLTQPISSASFFATTTLYSFLTRITWGHTHLVGAA
jgi:hypothetical protein